MASSHAKTQQHEPGIHDMISKLTDRLVSLSQGMPAHDHHHHAPHDSDEGFRIITLAGENKGSAMKATGLEELADMQGMIYNEENMISMYTNSNYQAVNNSIMLEGSCNADDPGVHIVISEDFDDDSDSDDSDSDSEESDDGDRKERKGKMKESKKKNGKKKEKKKEKVKSTKEHPSEIQEEKRKEHPSESGEEKTKHSE